MEERTKCLFNDCYGKEIAPCCFYCEERKDCPEKCKRKENKACIWLVDGSRAEGIK